MSLSAAHSVVSTARQHIANLEATLQADREGATNGENGADLAWEGSPRTAPAAGSTPSLRS